MKTFNLAILSGDGIGPEIMAEAQTILEYLKQAGLVDFEIQEALVGGASIRDSGVAITNATLDMVKTADAILFGAVGDYSFDHLPQLERPETAILKLRKELELFANIRPIVIFDELIANSNLKAEVLQNVDFVIVRELTGDIYFGEPRGEKKINGVRHGFNTMTYSEPEIERIANVGFKLAETRRRKITSVDKANVLETMQLWRDVVSRVSESYKDIELQHLYVDNAAMQLINSPAQFDVIVTGNIFGDILSDQASMITGSIGLLPSASLNEGLFGLYEPIHGSAPDIAGKNKANPLAMMLSMAMMFRHSLDRTDIANFIEQAVKNTLGKKIATPDFCREGWRKISTNDMGREVLKELSKLC